MQVHGQTSGRGLRFGQTIQAVRKKQKLSRPALEREILKVYGFEHPITYRISVEVIKRVERGAVAKIDRELVDGLWRGLTAKLDQKAAQLIRNELYVAADLNGLVDSEQAPDRLDLRIVHISREIRKECDQFIKSIDFSNLTDDEMDFVVCMAMELVARSHKETKPRGDEATTA